MIIEKALEKSKRARKAARQVPGEAAAILSETPEPVKRDSGKAGTPEPKKAPPPKSRSVELDPCVIEDHRCLGDLSKPEEVESYKILRTRLHQQMKHKGSKTLMITSPSAGDGKTLTAINLAFSFAKHYHQTVLLVDCDFRKQNIHKTLGYDDGPNLIDYLLDGVPLADTMVRMGNEKLVTISGNRTIQGSAELLGSPQMMELVREIKERYQDRIIIFDLPPVLFTADAMAFEPLVDAILMVVASGKTSMKDVQKAVEGLPREKILGYAMNRSNVHTNGYYKHSY
jgi:non-specific protein-tyrosine kinase